MILKTKLQLVEEINELKDDLHELSENYNDNKLTRQDLNREVRFLKSKEYPREELRKVTSRFADVTARYDREMADAKSEVARITEENDKDTKWYDDAMKAMEGNGEAKGYADGLKAGISQMEESNKLLIKALSDAKIPVPSQTIVNGSEIVK